MGPHQMIITSIDRCELLSGSQLIKQFRKVQIFLIIPELSVGGGDGFPAAANKAGSLVYSRTTVTFFPINFFRTNSFASKAQGSSGRVRVPLRGHLQIIQVSPPKVVVTELRPSTHVSLHHHRYFHPRESPQHNPQIQLLSPDPGTLSFLQQLEVAIPINMNLFSFTKTLAHFLSSHRAY